MEDNNKENGLTDKKIKWDKILTWGSLALAVTSPLIGVGVALLARSLMKNSSDKETNVVTLISIFLGSFLFILDLVLKLIYVI